MQPTITRDFHKKLLLFNVDIVGQIEYAPCEVSGYPIIGEKVIVMNCIWVLRKAKGHNFGKMLVDDMIQSEKNTCSFATIALENHWSPWFKKEQIEKLGFKLIDEIKVAHKAKHTKQTFSIHLMWMPMKEESEKLFRNKQKLLRGEYFCFAHPLYNPQF